MTIAAVVAVAVAVAVAAGVVATPDHLVAAVVAAGVVAERWCQREKSTRQQSDRRRLSHRCQGASVSPRVSPRVRG